MYVQAFSSGTAKGHRGRLYAAFQLPVHQEGHPSAFPMKPISLVFLSALLSITHVFSQEEKAADLNIVSTARILGIIPDGTPPPPSPPKPELFIPKRDIIETTTHEQGGRTITIRQVKPFDLPPPPAPLEQAVVQRDEEFSASLANYRADHPKSGLLFLGATVYRSQDSRPRTLVRYWPEGTREDITFWSSADFALIAGGIQSFVDSASDTHHIFMSWSNVEIDRMADLQAVKGRESEAPHMPDFPEGKATFEIVGTQPAAEDLPPIQALHDLYNSEYDRLQKAYEGREKARLEHEAELKANPPKPQNITLNYWRTEKPASKEKGGATR